jgi:polyhydroxybutyrate depolymerase
MRGSIVVAIVLAAAAAAVGVASTAHAQNGTGAAAASTCALQHASGVTELKLRSDGRERSYRLFVPQSYDASKALPLVLDMHGSGGTAERQAGNSRFEALAAKEGFVVASLQAGAEGNRWNVPVTAERPNDVQYASDVIDHVAARVCTDLERVYATGFSGGARMSSLLACRLNDRIAAIAPMAGLRWPGPCAGRAIPVLTFHGLADPQNTYDGHVEARGLEWLESVPDALDGWARHNRCRGEAIVDDPPGPLATLSYRDCRAEVRLVRIDGLVHAWARTEVDATAEMWSFFKKHSL